MNAAEILALSPLCPSLERRRVLFAATAAQAPATDATGFPTGMHTPAVDRVLAKNQLLVMPDADASLICRDGALWITRYGDAEDYILGSGQRMAIRRGDQAVVLALQPSRVRLLAV